MIDRAGRYAMTSFFVLSVCLAEGCSSGPGTVGNLGGSENPPNQVATGGSFTITIPPVTMGGSTGAGGMSGGAGGSGPVSPTAGNCGSVTSKAERVPVDVLLVQDASGSMHWSIAEDCDCRARGNTGVPRCTNTSSCVDRWSTLKSAVAATVAANAGIQWGLELFADPENPGRSACNVAPEPQVPFGPNSATLIPQVLAAVSPESSTPTASAITVATAYLKRVDDGHKKAILLATDGQPNCATGKSSDSPDLDNTLVAIKAAADAGFPVYVVGIGPSGANMDNMAQRGGTSKYYPAASPEQLNDALAQISKVVATCTFTSASPPPDPALVYVYVDKQLVAKNGSNGWDFGADNSTVVLRGSVCDAVLSGKSTLVEVVFGCPGVAPDPIIP